MKLKKTAIFILLSAFVVKSHGQEVKFPAFSAEAHRGGRGLMPENTIEAMLNAMKIDGITTLEMDTHCQKEGKEVLT